MLLTRDKIIAEHYQLVRQLGQGSFGNVWLAHNMLADIDVAIKFYGTLDKNGLDDFRNEFKIAYNLRHPNLLNINHFDVFENCPYLVMPYCENGSVNSIVGKMGEKDIWHFILDVSAGLAFLHSLQPPIIHQDIKPANILITSDGRYVITDFGISRSFRIMLSRTANTPNTSSGTIAYMGPERFSERPMLVLASDIWAFGMTVYELMTGDILWEGMGGCVQLNGARIPNIENNRFSEKLKQLVASCLAVETWNRPTAAQIHEIAADQIKNPFKKEKFQLRPHPTPVNTEDFSKKQTYNSLSCAQSNQWNLKRIIAVAAACILTASLAVGGFMYFQHISEEQVFVNCKTKQDFENFIKNYPESPFVDNARQRITSMTPNIPEADSVNAMPRPAKTPKAVINKASTKNNGQKFNHQPPTVIYTIERQVPNPTSPKPAVTPAKTALPSISSNDMPSPAASLKSQSAISSSIQQKTQQEEMPITDSNFDIENEIPEHQNTTTVPANKSKIGSNMNIHVNIGNIPPRRYSSGSSRLNSSSPHQQYNHSSKQMNRNPRTIQQRQDRRHFR